MFQKIKYNMFISTMLTTTVLMTVGQLIYMWFFKQRTGMDFIVAIYQTLYSSFMTGIPEGINAETLTLYKETVEIALTNFVTLAPAVVIIFSIILAYGSYLVSKLIANITKRNKDAYVRFRDIKAPQFVAKGFTIFFLLSVFVSNSTVANCIINIVSIFSFILTVAGITFILRKMAERNVATPLRVLAGVGIFFSLCIPLASYFYVGTGLFDTYRDIRASQKHDNGGNDNE